MSDDDPGHILVTGATGTVGAPLAAQLLDADAPVRLAVRDPDAARERLGGGGEYVEFDLARPETWGRALDGIDRLFVLIPPGVGLEPLRSFADAAARVGVAHVVYLSILGAEKLPVIPHRRFERHLAGTGMATTFLRASYFMQNLTGIHRPEIVERDEVYVPAGDGVLSFVDARDVAAVAAAALTEGGHRDTAYDLTGPAALDFHEVARVLREELDRGITYADPSRPAFAWQMYRRGVPLGMVAFMLAEYSVVRLGRSGRTTDTVERVLGRPPRSMRTFVADHVGEFRPE